MTGFSRRKFITSSALAGAGLLVARRLAWAAGQSPFGLRKFVQALPGLGPSGANEFGNYVPVAVPNTAKFPGVDYYKIRMGQFAQLTHPDLPGPARFWGYADVTAGQAPDERYLGGLIIAKKNRPVQITFENTLPPTHPLPVDTSIPGAGLPQNRVAVHLHGGHIPWISDGGPFDWWTPDGQHGLSFLNNTIPGATGGTGMAEYDYPNDQSARLVWYHDHAVGITRLNAYVGLASGYLMVDDFEEALIRTRIVPSLPGLLRYGIPLVLQDKTFWDPAADPGYPTGTNAGDLWYSYQYDGELAPPDGASSVPPVSCVPEFFADTTMVNGAVYPYLNVEPRHYRFRLLNGCNARFLNLNLYAAQNASPTEANLSAPGPRIIQIGNEGGFLPFPVALNNPPVPFGVEPDVLPDGSPNPVAGNPKFYNLLLAPAERADLVIDFSKFAGQTLILYNDAPSPFPSGDPVNDWQTVGTSPDTRTMLQFRVARSVTGSRDPLSLSILETLAVRGPVLPNPLLPEEGLNLRNVNHRWLTLNEDFDQFGRLIQRVGTVDTMSTDPFGLPYEAQPTEVARDGDVEIWHILNLTGDTHPMHFHLFDVRLIERRPFDDADYTGGVPTYTGPGRGPDANERRWKETVRMNPHEVVTVAMRIKLARVPFDVPASPRLDTSYGIRGHEFVWHCHILEHEEHDMMRPLVVIP